MEPPDAEDEEAFRKFVVVSAIRSGHSLELRGVYFRTPVSLDYLSQIVNFQKEMWKKRKDEIEELGTFRNLRPRDCHKAKMEIERWAKRSDLRIRLNRRFRNSWVSVPAGPWPDIKDLHLDIFYDGNGCMIRVRDLIMLLRQADRILQQIHHPQWKRGLERNRQTLAAFANRYNRLSAEHTKASKSYVGLLRVLYRICGLKTNEIEKRHLMKSLRRMKL